MFMGNGKGTPSLRWYIIYKCGFRIYQSHRSQSHALVRKSNEPCSGVFKETSGRVIPKVLSLCPTLLPIRTHTILPCVWKKLNPKLYFCELKCYLGPLRMRFKSRVHEIVRAQKKASKGHPNTPPKSRSV